MCTVRNNGDSRSVDQSSEWQPFLNLLKQPLNEATQRSNISVPFAHMDRRQGTWAFDSPPHGNHQTVGRWLAPPKDYSPLGFSTSVPGNLAELEGATSASVPDTTDISPAEAWKPATSELYFLGPPPFFANATLSPRLPLFISRFPPVLALSSWRKHAQHERSGYVSFAAKSFARWWRNSFYGSQSFWLFLYFSFNLLLTLSNKSVMTTFPFPYSLTAIHALCSSFGGYILRRRGLYNPRRLNIRDELVLAAFSVLYSVNVAVSNVSLHLVTVPVRKQSIFLPSYSKTALSIVSSSGAGGNSNLYPISLFPSPWQANEHIQAHYPRSCHNWSRRCVSFRRIIPFSLLIHRHIVWSLVHMGIITLHGGVFALPCLEHFSLP